jgi:hypothetical protein
MSAEQTPEQIVDALYTFGAEQLHNGVAPAEVERKLVEKGLSAELAGTVVDNLVKARAKMNKEAGQKNMLYGALWCIGGTIVTVVSLQSASRGGVIAWGAILFGGIQFIRGVMQTASE